MILFTFSTFTIKKDPNPKERLVTKINVEPFPLGVYPDKKEIIENPEVENFANKYLNLAKNDYRPEQWFDRLLNDLTQTKFYQLLASPRSRTLVIYPGERKEEIIKNFGDILNWSKEEREKFAKLITNNKPILADGKFFPGRYVVDKDINPTTLADTLNQKFSNEIYARYSDDISNKVSLKETLIIASLLEREAYDFNDMRYISGIIWNRIFIDMPLQLDATLQYVRGSNPYEPTWWPKVNPNDKYIDSLFNTYKNTGLPPIPISNPSPEAVVAALNPRVTDCLFYFHDQYGGFHCSNSYEEHVKMLREVY
ncbi:MAG: endolytic transglycosylase MltG [Candidatus Paceibacterota bacterium]